MMWKSALAKKMNTSLKTQKNTYGKPKEF